MRWCFHFLHLFWKIYLSSLGVFEVYFWNFLLLDSIYVVIWSKKKYSEQLEMHILFNINKNFGLNLLFPGIKYPQWAVIWSVTVLEIYLVFVDVFSCFVKCLIFFFEFTRNFSNKWKTMKINEEVLLPLWNHSAKNVLQTSWNRSQCIQWIFRHYL